MEAPLGQDQPGCTHARQPHPEQDDEGAGGDVEGALVGEEKTPHGRGARPQGGEDDGEPAHEAEHPGQHRRRRATPPAVALGAGASEVGRVLTAHQRALDIAAGAVVVVLGLWLAGVGTPRLFLTERRFHPLPSKLGWWAPPVMGMAFAFGWTPCIGPVLGGVLGLAAERATLTSGLVLLVAYSLGLGVPFLATGLAFGRLTVLAARVRHRLWLVDLVAGAALVAFGVLLLTGELHLVSSAISSALRAMGLGRLAVS